MKPYKIEDFAADHPGVEFPWHEQLSEAAAAAIRAQITARLNLSETVTDPVALVEALDARSVVIEHTDANDDSFDLGRIFRLAHLTLPRVVLINWHRFDSVDRMNFEDLRRYFWDIWYPGADDIDIFPETLDWILSVTHDGIVRAVTFQSKHPDCKRALEANE